MFQTTRYHSLTWERLVETGWVTLEVNTAGVATMVFVGKR